MELMVWYCTGNGANGLVLDWDWGEWSGTGLGIGLLIWYWTGNGANGLVLDCEWG